MNVKVNNAEEGFSLKITPFASFVFIHREQNWRGKPFFGKPVSEMILNFFGLTSIWMEEIKERKVLRTKSTTVFGHKDHKGVNNQQFSFLYWRLEPKDGLS